VRSSRIALAVALPSRIVAVIGAHSARCRALLGEQAPR
jgi:hypothetical protein